MNAPVKMSPEQLYAANMQARTLVLGNAVEMTQQIYGQAFTNYVAGQPLVINVPIRNVGLIKRFYIELIATVARSAAETHTRTSFGPANLLSQVILTDLSNQTRINTTGWHLHYLATARRQLAFGAAFTSDTPTGIAANGNVITAPSSISTAGNKTLYMCYEIPCAYSDVDLRGAIYANVVNATMNLQLTVTPNLSVTSTANKVQAVYQSSTTDLLGMSNLQVNVYQVYLDQLPIGQNGPILPLSDLGTVYLLNNTNVTGLSVSADNAVPYANFRQFLSTFLIYDNAGTLNAGTDVNSFALQSANYTNIFKTDPMLNLLMTRTKINDDYPSGMYYFDHRSKPISTMQYGNMQLVVNPSSVSGATSQFLIGYEALALVNQVVQAGSLYQA